MVVKTIECSPNRSARIALLFMLMVKRDMCAPNGLQVGSTVGVWSRYSLAKLVTSAENIPSWYCELQYRSASRSGTFGKISLVILLQLTSREKASIV